MSAFKVTPATTAHALMMLGTVGIAAEQLRAALAHKEARIAELIEALKECAKLESAEEIRAVARAALDAAGVKP